jgi:activating signal cointegrator 1
MSEERQLRVLTVRQPRATLLVHRIKCNDTFTWEAPYRGLVAIHAADTITQPERDMSDTIIYKAALNRCGYRDWTELPVGAIVGVGTLNGVTSVGCYNIDMATLEFALGDYSENRFVWHFNDMRPVSPIVGLRGHIGLWTPSELLRDLILKRSGFDRDQPVKASQTPVATRRESIPTFPRDYLTGRMSAVDRPR